MKVVRTFCIFLWVKIMDITIGKYADLDFSQILALYESVGWTNYTKDPDMLKAALANSLAVIGAFQGGKLVGLARAVGDGASILYVQDILVIPGFQRMGIGSRLLKRLLAMYPRVYQKVLLTDDTEKTVGFYKSLGFVPLEDVGCRGFLRMEAAAESGSAN